MTGGRRIGYYFGEAFRSLRANLATTMAATVTVLIVMFLAGVGIALGSYIYNYTEKVKQDVTLKVYLAEDATSDQKETIQTTLKDDSRIASFTYVTKDDALAEMTTRLGADNPVIKNLYGNPLPASFRVKAKDSDDVKLIAADIKGLKGLERSRPGAENPDYGSRTADRVLKVGGTIEAVVAGMAVVLAIASVLLIGNTIRLSIFARRREVEVMKLVGATNWFVRLPFMLEGMICGLLGAAAAVVLIYVSYEALLKDKFDSAIAGASTGVGAMDVKLLAVILLVAGLGLGAAGAGLTMRRFLRV